MLESNYFIYSFFTLLFFCITFTVILFFKKLGVVDKPDGIRKIHKGEVSFGGGVALYLSISLIFFLFFPQYTFGIDGEHPQLRDIWIISSSILLLGLWDDVRPLAPSFRLIVQIFASWIVIISTDLYVTNFGNLLGFGDIEVGELGIPLTIFMVVGICNAFNMLDGMDGLVSIVLLVPVTFISFIAVSNGSPGLIFIGSFALFYFLLFNLGFFGKRFKLFLGDSGSLWLGFITAWFLICLTQKEEGSSLFDPVTSLWFVIIPLVDALSTFLSRMTKKKSIFLGDRTHLHHTLLDTGLKKWKVLFVFLCLSLLCSLAGYTFVLLESKESMQFYGFLTLWIFYFLLIKYPLVIRYHS